MALSFQELVSGAPRALDMYRREAEQAIDAQLTDKFDSTVPPPCTVTVRSELVEHPLVQHQLRVLYLSREIGEEKVWRQMQFRKEAGGWTDIVFWW